MRLPVLTAAVMMVVTAAAQKKISEKYVSSVLQDTVAYNVWLPEGWNSNQQYPCLYLYNYGALGFDELGENLMVTDVEYYSDVLQKIPKTIVVSLLLNKNRIDYDYKTGQLGKSGLLFLRCLKQEIIPLVEQKFKASASRTYAGHSYSASYANYLFLHEPGLFNGYIVMAPEKLEPADPLFEPDQKIIDHYNTTTTSYYIATGSYDLGRRQDYGEEIFKKLKQIDSTKIRSKYDRYIAVDHMDIAIKALPAALEYIYRPFTSYLDIDSVGNVTEELERVEKMLKQLYGLPLEKNSTNYGHFLSLAVKSKDTAGLLKALSYFTAPSTKGLDFVNFAYFCDQFPFPAKAVEYYRKAIEKSKKDEMNTVQGAFNLVMSYRRLAFNAYKDDKAKGWSVLQEALKDTAVKDPVIHFYVGRFAATNDYQVKEGLKHLLFFLSSKADAKTWSINGYDVYYMIGKSYFLLKDKANAKTYLQKALDERPHYPEATQLLNSL
ncbi:MAG: tetratricopeptide repeat protein [Williamsia sp.]|nr:tetratricopeptide repeat protein [Williamsia sp.]